MRIGLVAMTARAMTLALPRIRLTLPMSDPSCRARPLAWQLRLRKGRDDERPPR
jgi:hypothetical protein